MLFVVSVLFHFKSFVEIFLLVYKKELNFCYFLEMLLQLLLFNFFYVGILQVRGQVTKPNCVIKSADVAFVIDASGSVASAEWKQVSVYFHYSLKGVRKVFAF